MNRRTSSVFAFSSSAVAAALAATMMAGSALADDITIDTTPFVSQLTRAEVKADLMSQRDQSSSAGSEWQMQRSYAVQDSGYTRQQARTDYIAARDEVHAMTSEDGGSASLAQLRAPSRVVTTAGFSR